MRALLGFGLICLLALNAQAKSPIPDIRDSYGVALADFDGDGLLDIYLVGFRTLNRLLINNGDGTFHDKSIPAGVGGNLMPQGIRNLELGASAVDFDNDGYVDILICGWGESLDLLKNRGDGTFYSVTRRMGLKRDVDANMAVWGDIDGDGYLDLLLTNETGPVRLYRNDHGLRLIPIPLEGTGIAADSGSQGALWCDLDLDGKLDLVITGWKNPVRVYRQVTPFKFEPVDLGIKFPPGMRCNAVLPGDIDGDGDADLLVTVRQGPNLLLVNQTDPPRRAADPSDWKLEPKPLRFREEAQARGLRDTLDSYGGAFADFDGDGDPDLFLTTRTFNFYYENRNGYFVRRELADVGLDDDDSYYNTGFMTGDLTPDPGDEMFLVSRDSASAILSGPIPLGRRLKVILHGVQSNRFGIGAELSLWSNDALAEADASGPAEINPGNPGVTSETRHQGKKKLLAAPSLRVSPRAAFSPDSWRLRQSQQVADGSGYLSSYIGPITFYLPSPVSPDSAAKAQNSVKTPSGVKAADGVSEGVVDSAKRGLNARMAPPEMRIRVRFPDGKVTVRKIYPADSVLEVWEGGPIATAYVRGSRRAYALLRDPLARRSILLTLLGAVIAFLVLRTALRAMAASIARKQYTKELVEKNRELQELIQEVSRTQQQLIHSEKLAALGQLVAGIAHELNNPIGFIYANLFQIRKYLGALEGIPLDDATRKVVAKMDQALKESQEGSIRIRDIVQNLRGLSRAGITARPGAGGKAAGQAGQVGENGKAETPMLNKRPCDLRHLMDKTLLLAQTNFSKNISVAKEYSETPLIEADETQIQQVFLNILVNAGQAMGEQGSLHIAIRPEGKVAMISIRDNGPGISAENLKHIFEPFFTTKAVGQGIGLGLHICYQIIAAHQGKIEARSTGQGAEFLIQLPLDGK